MNDTYVECLVERKPNPFSILIKGGMIALCAVCLILSFAMPFMLIVGVIIGVLAGYFVFPMLSIEYEYLYLDKEISIDKIMSRQKRKKELVLDLIKMELLAPASSHEFDSYLNRKVQIKDYSSGIEGEGHKPYYLAYHDEKAEMLVKLEPNEEMLKAIKLVAPRKVLS